MKNSVLLATFLGLVGVLEAVKAQETATAPPPATPAPTPAVVPLAIEVDLTAQKAWVLQDGKRVYETAISSGRAGHETPTGNFTVLEKDLDHKSSLYGRLVDSAGRVLIADADSDTPVPAGAKFVQAPMHHFLRFDGAIGMHAGRLPGYPASHGCIRLPAGKAALFYNIAELGIPVRVFGKAPRTGGSAGVAASGKKEPPKAAAAASPVPVAPPKANRGWFWMRKTAGS